MRLNIVYGGTFDPVHNGHLAVAAAAQAAFRADIRFLPSADPPHRPPADADAVQRAEMVEAAIAGRPGWHCDRRELHRGGPSYSVLSLREMRAESSPAQPIAWLTGMDAFLGLAGWHAWRELFGLCHFIVVERPGQGLAHMPEALRHACAGRWTETPEALQHAPAGGVYRLPMALREESSTAIRRGLAEGRNMNALLPAPVADYIRAHGLYPSGV